MTNLAAIDPTWDGTCPCESKDAHDPDCRQLHGPDCTVDCYSRFGCPTRLVEEIQRLRALTATCSCGPTYATYEGPEPDCPVHGAVRAYNEAAAEVQRLREENVRLRNLAEKTEAWRAVLRIPADVLERMWQHAWSAHPMEACGIVTSKQRHVPIRNCSPRPMVAYQFAPEAQLQAWQDMRQNEEELMVIYHSHTSRDSKPSSADHSLAAYSGAYYLIISTHDHTARAFTLQNELAPALVEIPLEVVPRHK